MSAFPPLETVGEIERLFEAGIPKDGPDRDQRLGWASQLAQLMVRVGELGQSYATDLVMAAQYESLWWNIYGFGTTELAIAGPTDFAKAWSGFTQRHETISSTPGSGAS